MSPVHADDLERGLAARGVRFGSGVPCSLLGPVIEALNGGGDVRYLGATSEGEALALAAGAWLAGVEAAALCQNSGLGNMVNPLSSLCRPFGIPALVLCSWRGRPGDGDEEHHRPMGAGMHALLDALDVPHGSLPSEPDGLEPALDRAFAAMAERERPYVAIVEPGTFAGPRRRREPRERPATGTLHALGTGRRTLTRFAALEEVAARLPGDAAVVATTGYTGRELFALDDREQFFYQVGSMGCASAIGLGVALHTPQPVVVLDGDGAALMKLGNLATIGLAAPRNLVHVVLDNGVHDSTGGQATAAPGVDFARVAIACGYRRAFGCDDAAQLGAALDAALDGAGPALVHMRIAPGSPAMPRPSIGPYDVARRFRSFVARSGGRALQPVAEGAAS